MPDLRSRLAIKKENEEEILNREKEEKTKSIEKKKKKMYRDSASRRVDARGEEGRIGIKRKRKKCTGTEKEADL